jgi:ribosomal protein S19
MKRSKWKGPFLRKSSLTEKLTVLPRNYEITSKIVRLTFNVHSGRIFTKLNITDDMIGHKVGEFVPTRERFVFKKKKKVKN